MQGLEASSLSRAIRFVRLTNLVFTRCAAPGMCMHEGLKCDHPPAAIGNNYPYKGYSYLHNP